MSNGWLEMDCGCCAGLEWGGEYPRECRSCGGRGFLIVHRVTGRIADYPGGPFRGQLSARELLEVIHANELEALLGGEDE